MVLRRSRDRCALPSRVSGAQVLMPLLWIEHSTSRIRSGA